MSPTSKQGSFASSVAWNLAGAGIPLAFAFFAIPRLLHGYGNARFGFLTIVWSLIGYFSIFDFGIGRALTKSVSERLGADRKGDIADIARTGLSMMFLLGIIACALLELFAPVLISLLKLEKNLYYESVVSLHILALGIPFVISSAGLIGLLEAYARFQSINRIRLVMGLLNFGAPLMVLHWSPSLIPTTIALAVSRTITTGFYFLTVRRLGVFGASSRFQYTHLKELLGFGGWITVSNLVSPLMAQMDKVVIGSMIALSLLPFYSVPGDLVNRLSFVPGAMIGVFFPAFAARWAGGGCASISALYVDAVKVMIAVLFPVALGMYALAPEGLSLWMGNNFAQHAIPQLRWLCIGFLINAIARIPHALLQAIGKPDVTAKLHILELPIYALGLWWLLVHYGILGAAVAWTGRMVLDFVLLSFCAAAAAPDLGRSIGLTFMVVLAGVAAVCASLLLAPLAFRLVLCIAIAAACFPYALRALLGIKHHD